jgi:hypothetical protein
VSPAGGGARALYRRWIVANGWSEAVGLGTTFLVGRAAASTIMAFASADQGRTPPGEPPALVQYGLAAVLGLVAGPVLGSAQWLVLRRHRRRAGLWLWANACAWAVGMPLIFLGMELVPWERGGIAAAAAIYGVCGAAGLAVGAIHGRMLLRLVSARPEGAGP